MESGARWEPVVCVYCPLKAGSIDGTDTRPHDRAVERAMKAIYKPNKKVQGDPECTLFIGRLDTMTSEDQLNKIFSKYGDIVNLCLVRDIVTGISKQYAFIEYSKHRYALRAKIEANHMALDGRDLLVDWECERTLSKWIPRRLGGGFGGRKESGQLRFGGTDRPHRKPIIVGQQHHSRGEKPDRGDEMWREKNAGRCRDDRPGGYRDDRSGGYRDDRPGGYRDDRPGGYRDDRPGRYRDDRPGRYRDDRPGGYRDNRPGGYRDDRPGGYRAVSRHDRRQDDERDHDRHRGGYEKRSTHTDRDKDRQAGRSKSNNEQSSSRYSDRDEDVPNSKIKTEPILVNKRNTHHLDIEIKQEKE